MVKNLPANAGSPAGDAGLIPGQEDPLGKEMASHSSTLAWNLVGYSPWRRKELDRTE